MSQRRKILAMLIVAGLIVGLGIQFVRPSLRVPAGPWQAKVDGALPYPVMQWRVLTSSVDRGSLSTATLSGNDAAVNAARSGQAIYPGGAVVGLVTWREREDPHWFGGRIADAPVSVEFVEFGSGAVPVYKRFAGSQLSALPTAEAPLRIAAIEEMKPVRLP